MAVIGMAGAYSITATVMAYMVKAAIAVKETSSPPAARTNSTPRANRPSTTDERTMSNRVASCQKLGLMLPTTRLTRTISMKVNADGRFASQFFSPVFC